MFQKTVKPRKSSTVVSSPVRKKRTGLLNKIRRDLSSGTFEDRIKQQATEIRNERTSVKMKLWEKAG